MSFDLFSIFFCASHFQRAPKKRPAEKSFSPLRRLTPDSPDLITSGTPPAAPTKESSTTAHASSLSIAANGPEAAPENASPDSGSADGLQLLSLNKGQQSGVNLLLFLPVCPNQTDGFSLPPPVSPTLSLHPQHLGIGTPFKLPFLTPLDFETQLEQDVNADAPLDLSMKCSSSAPALSGDRPQPVKNEPAALEACGEAGESQASRVCVQVSSANTETCTEESV